MHDIHEDVRRYTDMVETMIPDLESLVPPEARWDHEAMPAGTVTVQVAPRRDRSLTPAWAAVVAAAVVVMAIGLPLWLLAVRDGNEPVSPVSTVSTPTTDATPTTASSTTTSDAGVVPNRAAWPNAHVGIDQPFGTVNGNEWPPDTIVRITLNEMREQFAQTDNTGTFVAPSIYSIKPGDVIAVTVGDLRKEIVWREFTIDVFDRDTGLVEGAADLPDGTFISLTVYPTANDTPRNVYDVPVQGGRWSIVVDVALGPDSGAGANWIDEDGDVPGYYE